MNADPQSQPVDIKTASAIVVAIGGVIVTVTSWLDRRAKTQREEILKQHADKMDVLLLEHSRQIDTLSKEVQSLTQRVKSLEESQHDARAILCDVLVMDDAEGMKGRVREAINLLG